jgi:CheY-like chemotaxis protein
MIGFLKRKRILLLDDDPSMQRLVSTLLKREGFRVDTFLKGNDVIAALERQAYDALLLDLMMPHEGGMTVIRHLRESAPERLRNVVVLTASPNSVTANIREEVFAIVQKPFESEHLIDTIRRAAQ